MRTTGILLLLLFHVLASSCSAQLANDAQKCEKNVTSNPDLSLQGCTALIESGRLSEEDVFKVLLIRGVAYRNKGNYEQAIQDFDKAIRLKPDIAEAFNNRGVAYDYKGDYERAIQDYNQVIRLRPDYAAPFNNRGLVYHEKGEFDRAIQDFDQAIRLNPGRDLRAHWGEGGARPDEVSEISLEAHRLTRAVLIAVREPPLEALPIRIIGVISPFHQATAAQTIYEIGIFLTRK